VLAYHHKELAAWARTGHSSSRARNVGTSSVADLPRASAAGFEVYVLSSVADYQRRAGRCLSSLKVSQDFGGRLLRHGCQDLY